MRVLQVATRATGQISVAKEREGKGSEVSRRYRVRYPDARRGRKVASERAEGRIASGSSQEPKRKEDPENDTPVARAASTSAHCATPTLVQLTAAYKFHRQPDPNRPAPCPRRSAITTCPALLSSRQGTCTHATGHRRPRSLIQHCIACTSCA